MENKWICHHGHHGNASHCISCLHFAASLLPPITHCTGIAHYNSTLRTYILPQALLYISYLFVFHKAWDFTGDTLFSILTSYYKFQLSWPIVLPLGRCWTLWPCFSFWCLASGKYRKTSGNGTDCILIQIVGDVVAQILRWGPAHLYCYIVSGLQGCPEVSLSSCCPGLPFWLSSPVIRQWSRQGGVPPFCFSNNRKFYSPISIGITSFAKLTPPKI